MLGDLRFAIRRLRKDRGFAVAAVLTLALGIGATSAIFSLVNAVLLRPLPFPRSDHLVWARPADRTLPGGGTTPLSYPDFFDWRAQSRSLAAIACYRSQRATLTGSGEPRQLEGQTVSSEFFRVLGVRPLVGRDFRAEDEKPGSRVVMLSYGLWQSVFGGSASIAGGAVTLNGHRYTVAGVIPAGAGFPIQSPAPAFWTTLADDAEGENPPTAQRGYNSLDVIARLKSGATIEQARAELSVISRNLAAKYPDTNKPLTSAIVMPLIEHVAGNVKPALAVLFAAVMLVLLIACVNVGGLLLARGSRHRADLAVRTALGASRGRIVRQLLAEAMLLAVCGGALGILLSTWILSALLPFVPETLPRAARVSTDGTVLAFATVISLATGLLFGVLPAWRASRVAPVLWLRDGGRGIAGRRGENRLHDVLVAGEIAFGLVLLAGSGLLIRSFIRVLHVDPGFDRHGVLTADLNLPGARYSREQKIRFYGRLLEKLRRMPEVRTAAAGSPLPLGDNNIAVTFAIEGRPVPAADEPSEAINVITPDYFRAMRIPLLAGRAFTVRDDTGAAPVVIVNERFARKYFPGGNPLGKHIKPGLGDGTVKAPMREIVGVVGNVRREGITAAPDAEFYVPWQQAVITSPTLVIRTAGDPIAAAGPLRALVSGLDKDIPLYHVSTLEDLVSHAEAEPRFQTLLLAAFAAAALLLAAVGLYGVLSYMVAQRTAEIGVRVALGARRRDVLTMVLRRGLRLAASGLVAGLGASAILTRFLERMLYAVKPLDLVTFSMAAAVLFAVSMAASALPAWRAARIDPIATLRDQ